MELEWVTLGIQIICARYLANIRVRHSQKQVKNANTHTSTDLKSQDLQMVLTWQRNIIIGIFFFFKCSRKVHAKPVASVYPSPRTTQGLFSVVLLYAFHHYVPLTMKNRSRNCKVNELIHKPLSYSSAVQLNTFHLIMRQESQCSVVALILTILKFCYHGVSFKRKLF